jgi:hypothetical protein
MLHSMRRDRPLVLDFADRSDDELSGALEVLSSEMVTAIVDLGDRRSMLPSAMDALARTHHMLRAGGGRCAIVVAPPLAAQLVIRHPDGLLCAATRRQAAQALGFEHLGGWLRSG